MPTSALLAPTSFSPDALVPFLGMISVSAVAAVASVYCWISYISGIELLNISYRTYIESNFRCVVSICRFELPICRIELPIYRIELPIGLLKNSIYRIEIPIYRVGLPIYRIELPIYRIGLHCRIYHTTFCTSWRGHFADPAARAESYDCRSFWSCSLSASTSNPRGHF